MDFIRVNGVSLAYRDSRGGEARTTIVFSNSLGTDHRIWDKTVAGLGGTYATVLYDKRGHGLSDVGDAPYRIEDHVADLAGLLDHLGIKGAIICGLSVGGLIAQGLVAKRPDLVRGLVLCDTAPKVGTAEMWNTRIAAVEEGGVASIADTIIQRWFTPAFQNPENAAFAGYRNMLARTSAEGYAGTCAAIRDADLTAAASQISVPTLCLAGDHDMTTTPALVEAMARLIPGAQFEVITDAGHLPCIEKPDDIARHLTHFADAIGGGTN